MNGRYLALGDSLTAGYGVGMNRSFASLYFLNLQHSFPDLQYENLGINGLTSGQLANMISHTNVYRMIPQARIITVTIGSNDLLAIGKGLISGERVNPELALRDFCQNFSLLGKRIRSVNTSAALKIASIYNPLPPMDKQANAMAQCLVKSANHGISQIAREYGGVVVPVAKVFKGKEQLLLGPDHLHPNAAGHQVMADLFARY